MSNNYTRNKFVGVAVLAVMLMILVSCGVIWWVQSNPKKSELDIVKAKVGRLYILPTNETPALVTVLDQAKLSSAYLKQYAKKGDKLLLYQKTRRVVIYRPSLDKIVDIGVLELDPLNDATQ